MPLSKVESLADLSERARKDPRYEELAIESAKNLGAPLRKGPGQTELGFAIKALTNIAIEVEAETGEDGEAGVIEEINSLVLIEMDKPKGGGR